MGNNSKTTKSSEKAMRSALHAARLAAVQALYQIEQVKASPEEVMNEFLEHRLAQAPDQEHDILVDKVLFKRIILSFAKHEDEINKLIAGTLIEGWTLERLALVLLVILQSGCAELLFKRKTPASVVINEYVNVTKEFHGAKEPAFVNGVLDHIARTLKLEMKGNGPTQPTEIENYLKEYETSGVPNWEGEGGAT